MNAATETTATETDLFDFDMFGSTVKSAQEQEEQEQMLRQFRIASSRSLQVGNLRGVVR